MASDTASCGVENTRAPNNCSNCARCDDCASLRATSSTLAFAISTGFSSGPNACCCSVSARPSQNIPPCGTSCGAADVPATFCALTTPAADAACCATLGAASFSPASGPMLKFGWRYRYISDGGGR